MASEPPTPKKILLFGATGVIGKDLLAALVGAEPSFDKIGIFTSRATAQTKGAAMDQARNSGVEVVVGDVHSDEDVKRAYQGYDTVVSALGRSALPAQMPLLELAESSSTIRTFYPSEYGTDIEYGPSSAAERPHQPKLQVRRHIREHVRRLNITYLVTGPYADLYLGRQRGEAEAAGSFDVAASRAVLVGSGDEPVSLTTQRDVGRLLVAALRTPATQSPRTLRVNSFTTTPNAVVAEFERQTAARWHVDYTPLDALRDLERRAWAARDPAATLLTLRRIWAEGGTLYPERDNASIGDPELESLEDQVARAVAVARGEVTFRT